MNIKHERIQAGIQAKEIVERLRGMGYEGYSKSLQSQVEDPDKYGIRYVLPAERAVKAMIGKASVTRRTSGRRKAYKITYHADDGLHRRLELAQKRNGLQTMQATMDFLICRGLEADENGAEQGD